MKFTPSETLKLYPNEFCGLISPNPTRAFVDVGAMVQGNKLGIRVWFAWGPLIVVEDNYSSPTSPFLSDFLFTTSLFLSPFNNQSSILLYLLSVYFTFPTLAGMHIFNDPSRTKCGLTCFHPRESREWFAEWYGGEEIAKGDLRPQGISTCCWRSLDVFVNLRRVIFKYTNLLGTKLQILLGGLF